MILKIRDALGNEYDVPSIRGAGVSNIFMRENAGEYTLVFLLTDGREIEAGPLPPATPAAEHTHGSISYEGRVGSTAGLLLETGEGGAVQAGRKLLAGTTPPEEVTGLRAGDIYLYYEA